MPKKTRRQLIDDLAPLDLAPGEADPSLAAKEVARTKGIRKGFETPPKAVVMTPANRADLLREKQLLETTIVEEKRALAKENFWYFLTEVLFPHIWRDHYTDTLHLELCNELQNLQWGEEFWAFLRRKARKSYIINLADSWWRIVKDPNIRILMVGAREETVKPFARVMRSAFVKGAPGFEEFQRVFPDFVFPDSGSHLRQAFQFTVPPRNKVLADPTLRATYLGVAGAGWRCDVLKYDDAVERRNVSHPEMSMKTLMQMMDLYPLLDDTGNYNMTMGAGTRWAYHDPYGYILGEVEGEESNEDALRRLETKKMKVMVRHALEDPERMCEHCPPHIVKAYPHHHPTMEPNGIPCDFPIHDYQSVMDDYDRYSKSPSLGESLFWHQLMNVCLSPKDQKIQKEWFITAPFPYWPVQKRRVLSIDSADKDLQKEGLGDWMVAIFGEFDDYGRLLLAWGLRSNKWTRKEFQKKVLAWCKLTDWWPNLVVKEKFGDGAGAFLTDLGGMFMEHGHPVHLKVVTRGTRQGNVTKKLDWIIDNVQAPLEGAEVVFGRDFPPEIRRQAEHELTQLGMTKNDDVADTLAMFFIDGVRLKAHQRHAERPTQLQPPSLDLYSVGAPQRGPISPVQTMIQTAMEGKRFQAVAEELPTINTEKPPQKPPILEIKPDF
jgi:hypothetical protein